MISRGSDTNSYDGNGLHGILFSMRGNELLRGDSYNKSTIRNTIRRTGYSRVCMRGVFSRESNIK